MPYLMGGFPDLAGSLQVGEAYAERRRSRRARRAVLGSARGRPGIQAAGQRALEAGATFERCSRRSPRPLAGEVPVVVMCYANPILARGDDAVAARLAEPASRA